MAAEDQGKAILVMTIELGAGRFDKLVVHEEDEPDDLARAFCEKHNLGSNIVQALTQQIEGNIDELVREQLSTSGRIDPEVQKSPRKAPKQLQKQPIRKAVSKEPPKPQSSSPSKKPTYTTLGHKLYYKALKSKETLEKKRSEAKKASEEQLNQSLTFRPQINKRSGRLTARRGKPEEELLRKGKKSQEKLAKQREDREEADTVGLTFVPGINPR